MGFKYPSKLYALLIFTKIDILIDEFIGTKRLFSWLIYNSITQQYQPVSLSRVENQTNSNKYKQFLILKTEKNLKAITLPFCHMVQINMNT